jgi:hypothetical protein
LGSGLQEASSGGGALLPSRAAGTKQLAVIALVVALAPHALQEESARQ